jgi:hypothetical protein
MSIIHIGRTIPKGFIELPGSVHIGKGIWAFRVEIDPNNKPKKKVRRLK